MECSDGRVRADYCRQCGVCEISVVLARWGEGRELQLGTRRSMYGKRIEQNYCHDRYAAPPAPVATVGFAASAAAASAAAAVSQPDALAVEPWRAVLAGQKRPATHRLAASAAVPAAMPPDALLVEQ